MALAQDLGACWIEENNVVIRKWKQFERGQQSTVELDIRKQCCLEVQKLLGKMQGVPAVPGYIQLELTVVYNTLLFLISDSNWNETEALLILSVRRALEALGCHKPDHEPLILWQVALKTVGCTEYISYFHKLLCVQWALWLSTCQHEKIRDLLNVNFQKENPSEDLLVVLRDLRLSTEENASLLDAVTAKEFKDLLHICTVIAQGTEKMKEEKYSEALQAFQEATTLPARRTLLAQVHTLTGICLTKMGRFQSSLKCFRMAMEVDFGCRSALHQSALVYRQLGDAVAEIEALRLLHSALTLPTGNTSSSKWTPLISPVVLFSSQSLTSILTYPSCPSALHTLAHACLRNNRISEAVEHYLDLMASLLSEGKQLVTEERHTGLPRIPEIYLETAFALLKGNRFRDALAVCEEIVDKTRNLIPERLDLTIEDLETRGASDERVSSGRDAAAVKDKLDGVLWAGNAYLIQGHVYYQMKDSKEAVTHYSRSIDVLFKVNVAHNDWIIREPGERESDGVKAQTMHRIRALALAGRGLAFVDRGQLKQALRDFQLSLQFSPGSDNTKLCLVEVLWRLERKHEAVTRWKTVHESTKASALQYLSPYLQEHPTNWSHFDLKDVQEKIEEFINNTSISV